MNLTKRSFSLSLFVLCSFLVLVFTTQPSAVQTCTPIEDVVPAWPRNSIVYVNLSNLNSEQRRQVTAAIAAWNQANQTNGSYVHFSFDTPTIPNPFQLTFKIGDTKVDQRTSQIPASQIDTSDCVDGQGNLKCATISFNLNVKNIDSSGNQVPQLDEKVSSTGFLKAALHELGHSMGFGEGVVNRNSPTSGACAADGQTPGSTVMNGMCGANDWGNNMPTSVQPCDNQRITSVSQYQCSLSAAACSPYAFEPASCLCMTMGTGGGDPDGCPDHPSSVECGSWFICEGCCPCTPIIVDVEGNGFSLTSAEEGVAFDLNGNGVKQGRLAWSSVASDDAWLVLDRNGNGLIDDGSEMFGNFTPQPSPREGLPKNGFNALAVFDEIAFGGDGDGWLTSRDRVFRLLRLWQDLNHDGVSQASELCSLEERGLSSIDLSYKSSERVDQYGNHFRFRAKIQDVRGRHLGRWAWDVFLTSAP
jgi:hypothetical protein